MISEAVRRTIERAPRLPGVYLFKNAAGKVLYVGKAKSLLPRLRAYINPAADERFRVFVFVPHIRDVEWLVTDTEKEAILLEANLIKTHQPRYNILMRDDKSYVSLRLTSHQFPRLFVTRTLVQDGSTYFGPYSSVADVRKTLKWIQKIFQVRDCSDEYFRSRARPCLQHEIKRCTAPCVGKVTVEAYAEQVDESRRFLEGDRTELIEDLKEKMNAASARQEYEVAAAFRDRLQAITHTLERQEVADSSQDANIDAVGLSGDADATLIKVVRVRRGRITATEELLVNKSVQAAAEILRAFVQQFYFSEFPVRDIPEEVLLPHTIEDQSALSELLTERRGRKANICVPKRGRRRRFLEMARRNAEVALAERKRKSESNQALLEDAARTLHLPKPPYRIEGYDISNISGTEPVGAQVVFTDGEPDKNQYRRYIIRSVKGPNDFAMLREVFDRRFRRLDDENRPDLVLVDGGKGQLRQVVEVFRELGVSGIPILSLAKEKQWVTQAGQRDAPERIFIPNQKNPIVLSPSSKVLHLLMRVRDEAHRFGITGHRKRRGKRAVASTLTQVRGIGSHRQRALLRAFSNMESLKNASPEKIASDAKIPIEVARRLFDFLTLRSDTPR